MDLDKEKRIISQRLMWIWTELQDPLSQARRAYLNEVESGLMNSLQQIANASDGESAAPGVNPLKRSAPSPDRQEPRYGFRPHRKTKYTDDYAFIEESDFTDDDMELNSDEIAEDEPAIDHEIVISGSHEEDDDSMIVPDYDSSEHLGSPSSPEATDHGSDAESMEGWEAQVADHDSQYDSNEDEEAQRDSYNSGEDSTGDTEIMSEHSRSSDEDSTEDTESKVEENKDLNEDLVEDMGIKVEGSRGLDEDLVEKMVRADPYLHAVPSFTSNLEEFDGFRWSPN